MCIVSKSRPLLIYLLPLVFLLGCSEDLLISETAAEGAVSYVIPDSGRILQAGSDFSLKISYDEQKIDPQYVSLEIESDTEEVVYSRFYGIDEALAGVDGWTLPVDASGFYEAVVSVQNSGGQTLDQKVVYFFAGDGALSVSGIDVFPAVFYPGGQGILDSHLDLNGIEDPYLRWTVAGRVVGYGHLSDGWGQIAVSAPNVPGVYPVLLELFPESPGDTIENFSFRSPYLHETQIFVSDNPSSEKEGLGPADQYRCLYKFQGTTFDSHSFDDELRAKISGNGKLSVFSGVFGYKLGAASSIAIPVSGGGYASEGPVPFSFIMRGIFQNDPSSEELLFTSYAEDGDDALRFGVSSGGTLTVTYLSGQSSVIYPLNAEGIRWRDVREIGVSLFPLEDGLEAYWFIDGIYVGAVSLGLVDSNYLDGRVVLGNPEGTANQPWLWDDFGVYSRQGDEPQAFRSFFAEHQELKYDSRLVWAEGFDSPLGPDLNIDIAGEVRFDHGRVVLSPGSSVLFPGASLEDGSLTWSFDFQMESLPESGRLVLESLTWSEEGKEEVQRLASYEFGEGELSAGNLKEMRVLDDERLDLVLEKRNDRLFLGDLRLPQVVGSDPEFRMRVEADVESVGGLWSCESVTLFRDWSELVKQSEGLLQLALLDADLKN